MSKLNRLTVYSLLIVFSIIWIIYSADSSGISNGFAPQEGFSAPDFTLKTSTGEIYTLSELKGQAVLVNLWATWCPPCRAEMPAMQEMYEEYQSQGLVVLAINMTYQDTFSQVMPFANQHGLTFPILLDETGEVGQAYQLRSLPSSFFINRAGIVTEVVIGGPMSEALLRTRIENILK